MTMLQIATIVVSRGDVFLLGEAYAFGVVWSFALKALGVLVLRYQRHDQEYKMPLNIRHRGKEIPIGLGLPPRLCFWWPSPTCSRKRSPPSTASPSPSCCNVLFMISERINARKKREQRRIWKNSTWIISRRSAASLRARPGCVLVAVRDYQPLMST